MSSATGWALRGLLAAGVICIGLGAASAGSFVFTKIADENDLVPGVGVNFTGFNMAAPFGAALVFAYSIVLAGPWGMRPRRDRLCVGVPLRRRQRRSCLARCDVDARLPGPALSCF